MRCRFIQVGILAAHRVAEPFVSQHRRLRNWRGTGVGFCLYNSPELVAESDTSGDGAEDTCRVVVPKSSAGVRGTLTVISSVGQTMQSIVVVAHVISICIAFCHQIATRTVCWGVGAIISR